MSQRASPTLIGAFVIGALALAVAGVFLLGSGDLFRKTYSFVSYFEDSVNGLREGAPVKFKGVEIGIVDEIRLPLGPDNPPVMVVFSLDAEEISASADKEFDQADLDHVIAAGMRAQLEQDSFVTGLLHLSLEFAPDSEVTLHEPIPGLPELPTIQTSFAEFTARMRQLVDRLERADLAALVVELRETARAAGDLLRSDQLERTLDSFEQALLEIRHTSAVLREKVAPLTDSLLATSESVRNVGGELQTGVADAREVLAAIRELTRSLDQSVSQLTRSADAALRAVHGVIDPGSPPIAGLQEALSELSAAARAARAVLEILEREPAALVRGLGDPE